MERKYLAIMICCGLCLATPVNAEYYFNPKFIGQDVADLSAFEKGDGVPPGNYSTDIYINDTLMQQSANVVFAKDAKGNIAPQFTAKMLMALGIKTDGLQGKQPQEPLSAVYFLQDITPGASSEFDLAKQRLDIAMPQIYIQKEARGYIPPEQWEQGINALLFNYNLTGNQSRQDAGFNSANTFLNLQSGINVGPWRLRDNSIWSHNTSQNGKSFAQWQHVSMVVERNLADIKGKIRAGDTNTSGDLFDSVSTRGIQLMSDDNMLPDSQRGFAPTVRGIAQSNAKVTIRQNGYLIYQTYVPAGAFEINDLFPTAGSGDLEVTVTEMNGAETRYTMPYSTVPLMQRDGRFKYALSAGKFRGAGNRQDSPHFLQSDLAWGLPYDITLYGGTQLSNNYRALAAGVGKNIGQLGAVSLDLTQANSVLADGSAHSGQSARFLYAKSFNTLGTSFQLMGYRYSTEGYYTLADTTYRTMQGYNAEPDPDYRPDFYNLHTARKSKFQMSINQPIRGWGAFYLSGAEQRYWHTDQKERLFQAGYNGSWKGINYSLAWSYSDAPGQPASDRRVSVNLSTSLNTLLGLNERHNAWLTYNNSTDKNGSVAQSVGVSGTLLEGNNLSYTVQQGQASHGDPGHGNASLNYNGQYNNLDLGYGYDRHTQQINYGVSGGVVVHDEGITFSQPLGTTNVLVAAPGAANVGVENNAGVKTDWRGYAVVPYASTYRRNRISLDTRSLGHDVDLENAITDVVPTEGALVKATFDTRVGARTLMTLTRNGKPLPFGTILNNTEGSSTLIGDDGQAYLSGLKQEGTLEAQWGTRESEKCTAHYHLSDEAMKLPVSYSTAVCQ